MGRCQWVAGHAGRSLGSQEGIRICCANPKADIPPHAPCVQPASGPAAELNARAMLIQWIGDLPAMTMVTNTAIQPAANGPCYKCHLQGSPGPATKSTIYAGAWRACDPDSTQYKDGSLLNRNRNRNPNLGPAQPSPAQPGPAQPGPAQPGPAQPGPDELPFNLKDSAFFKTTARDADRALELGIKHENKRHPGRADHTGVIFVHTHVLDIPFLLIHIN